MELGAQRGAAAAIATAEADGDDQMPEKERKRLHYVTLKVAKEVQGAITPSEDNPTAPRANKDTQPCIELSGFHFGPSGAKVLATALLGIGPGLSGGCAAQSNSTASLETAALQ